MKMLKKVLTTFLLMSIIFCNIVYAFDPAISGQDGPSVEPEIADMVNVILGVIQWVGYAIAIGMLVYIGIKYVMSSASEKADLKRDSVNFFIGAIVILAAVTICTWCVTFFQSAGGGGGGQAPSGSPSNSSISTEIN